MHCQGSDKGLAAILDVKRRPLGTPGRNVVAVDLRGLLGPVPGVGRGRVKQDPLGVCPMAEMVAACAAATGGEAHIDPVGDPMATSGIASPTVGQASGIDEVSASGTGPRRRPSNRR